MNTNNIFSVANHQELILNQLKSDEGLPFSNILSAETIAEGIENVEYRERIYSPDIIIWMLLSQALEDDQSLQKSVSRLVAFCISRGRVAPSLNTAAYSKARSRLPEEVLSTLTQVSGKQMEQAILKDWLWKNKPIKLVDGSTVSMPDTAKNQESYPQPESQKEGVGFPIARIVTITSCATGAVLDMAIGRYAGKQTGEHALLRQLFGVFNAGDVVLGDNYYASYFLIAQLMQRGVDVVFPIHSARDSDFRLGKRLGKKDHIVEWLKPIKPEWMTPEEYETMPEHIEIRELAVENSKKGFRSRLRVIVTTFLDPKAVSKQDIAILYSQRWWIEVDLRSLKETMQMDILRGKTPVMVRKEIWAHLLAYNTIRKVMAQAAYLCKKRPRELSFKLALQTIESFRDAGILSKQADYVALLGAIAYKTVGSRPNRQEPRKIKRRAKSFPLLTKARKHYHQKAA